MMKTKISKVTCGGVNNNNEWVEIGDEKAVKKVAGALHEYYNFIIIGAMDEVKITKYDILSGKKAKDLHPNNVKFFLHTLKARHKAFSETKKEKAEFFRGLVRSLRNAGSSFLTVNNNDEWVEIGDAKANENVKYELNKSI